jgi:hypothetical protein
MTPSGRRRCSPRRGSSSSAQDPAVAAAELARCRLDEAIVASWSGQFERTIAAAEESLRYEASRPGPIGPRRRGAQHAWARPGPAGSIRGGERGPSRGSSRFSLRSDGRAPDSRLTARHNWTLALQSTPARSGARSPNPTRSIAVSRELGGGPVSPYKLSSRASLLSYAGRHEEAIAVASARRSGALPALWGRKSRSGSTAWPPASRPRPGRFVEADLALAAMDRAFDAIPSPPAGLAGMRELFRARATDGPRCRAPRSLLRGARSSSSSSEKQPARDLLQALLIAARDRERPGQPRRGCHRCGARPGDGSVRPRRFRPLARARPRRARSGARRRERPAACPPREPASTRALDNLRDAVGADAPETRRAERQAAAAACGLSPADLAR